MIKAVNEGIKHGELHYNKESFLDINSSPEFLRALYALSRRFFAYALNDSRGKVLLRLRGFLHVFHLVEMTK